MNPTASILIPALNEEECLPGVLADLMPLARKMGWEVIVIDDGSADRTAEIAHENGTIVVSHHRSRGYGSALKTGMEFASADRVATLDGDGQHNPRDLVDLLAELDVADLVVGTRTGDHGTGFRRNAGRWVLRWVASRLVRRKIPDLNSGLRAARKGALNYVVPLLPSGYSFSTTSTLALIHLGDNVIFRPISVRARGGGRSPVKLLSDGLDLLFTILRLTCLFQPLRFFGTVGLISLVCGIAYAAWGALAGGVIPVGAVIALLAAVLGFSVGLLCDQISALRFSLLDSHAAHPRRLYGGPGAAAMRADQAAADPVSTERG